MKAHAFGAVLLAGILLVTASEVTAAVRAMPVTIRDPQGDNTGSTAATKDDIATVAAVAAAGKITFTVSTYNSFGRFTAPCVLVKSARPAGLALSICRLSAGAAPPCYTSVTLSKPYPLGGGCGGPAVIRLVGTKTVTYTVPLTMFTRFKPRPAELLWRAEVRGLKDCYPTPCDATAFGRTNI